MNRRIINGTIQNPSRLLSKGFELEVKDVMRRMAESLAKSFEGSNK